MPDDKVLALARTRLGRVLRGKYRLDRVLGIGGMAVVYAATHRNKKRFAIKMLHPELSMHETIRTRFLREGYVANTVDHPGAVAVLDDDVAEDGSAFIVMEYLDGSSIDAVWEKHGRHVPAALVVSIADAMLDVLAAAHGKGVVHRDIKPANVFLTYDGRLDVLDFGIARLRDETSSSATQTGAMMGTPAYMAPEQALGDSKNVDGQTDLWAVGATMFTLLTGELVHQGENASKLLVFAATKAARPIGTVKEDVPAEVAAVIDKALAFEKKDRWPSAAEMREALKGAWLAFAGGPIEALPRTEREAEAVTGLEETIASNPNVAGVVGQSGSNVGFDPTLDRRGPEGDTRVSGAPGSPVSVQSTGAALSSTSTKASPGKSTPPSRGRGRTAAALAVIAVGGVLAVLASRGALRSVSSAAAPKVAATTSEPRAGRAPATPAAAAAYEAALQAQRDGNGHEVERHLADAIAADPGLGAAYLRLAIIDVGEGRDVDGQQAYQRALEHRGTLGEIDLAILHAYEPRFRDPPDRGERTQRLEDVARKYPKDVFLQSLLAECLLTSHREPEAAQTVEAVLAIDPQYVPAIESKIALAQAQGDAKAVQALVDACIKSSPAASSCLWDRIGMAYAEGRCSDVRADARRVIGINPTDALAYGALADSLAALGEPVEAVTEALARSDANIPDPDKRHMGELNSAASLALLRGDFKAASSADAERVAFGATHPAVYETESSLEQIFIAVEEGDLVQARVLAKALRARISASAVGEHDIVKEGLLAVLSMRAGAITRDQLRTERERLLGYAHEDGARRGGKEDPFDTWRMIYAMDVESADEAADALAALAKIGGANPKPAEGFNRQIGEVYAFGGRGAEAIPLIERAAITCSQVGDVIGLTQGAFALGVAKEQTGDREGARAAYEKVIARWGKAIPRSVTAEKARARLSALGGSKK